MDSKAYFEKVMQDFNQFSNRVRFYLCSRPVDMRNGREGLARIIREALEHNPLDYNKDP